MVDRSGGAHDNSGRTVTRRSATKRSVQMNNGKYAVSSVEKALTLLGSFSQTVSQWTLSDLAREHKFPKSTVHNLLKTLQAFDLVLKIECTD